MKLNNDKGITLISLAIATLIIIVISGAIIFNTRNQISLRDINYLYEDIQNINGRVDDYYITYGELPVLCNYLNKDDLINMIHVKAESLGVSIAGGLITNPNDNDNYYVIEIEKLGGLSLNYGYDSDYQGVKNNKEINLEKPETKLYVINERTHQVYFPNGILADNIMYCTYKIDSELPQISRPEERKTELEVGDYVDYTYDNQTGYKLESIYSGDISEDQIISQTNDLKWRVLSINEDKSIDLISDNIADANAVKFAGALGYNNGVLLLNDICKKLYSNSKYGSNVTVRSINIDDIEKYYTQTGISAKENYEEELASGERIKYNDKKTFSVSFYPDLYKNENGSGINTTSVKRDGIGQSEYGYSNPTVKGNINSEISLTATQTAYKLSARNEDLFNKEVFDLIFGLNKNYWIASRMVSLSTDHILFGIAEIESNTISNKIIVDTTPDGESLDTTQYYIRPVVHLDSSVKIILREGTIEKMHKIAL